MDPDLADAAQVPRAEAPQHEVRLLADGLGELVGDDHGPRRGDVHQPARQVDRGAEEVALLAQGVTASDPDASGGDERVVGALVCDVEREVCGGGGVSDGEHHLVADHLDHATAVDGDGVVRQRLEPLDHRCELRVAALLARGGEPHEVGEADASDPRATAGCVGRPVVKGCRQVPPPGVGQERLERRADRLHRCRELDGIGGENLLERARLRVGHPGERLAEHPGHLHGHLGRHGPLLDQRSGHDQHLGVGLGEDAVPVGGVGEAEGSPQPP